MSYPNPARERAKKKDPNRKNVYEMKELIMHLSLDNFKKFFGELQDEKDENKEKGKRSKNVNGQPLFPNKAKINKTTLEEFRQIALTLCDETLLAMDIQQTIFRMLEGQANLRVEIRNLLPKSDQQPALDPLQQAINKMKADETRLKIDFLAAPSLRRIFAVIGDRRPVELTAKRIRQINTKELQDAMKALDDNVLCAEDVVSEIDTDYQKSGKFKAQQAKLKKQETVKPPPPQKIIPPKPTAAPVTVDLLKKALDQADLVTNQELQKQTTKPTFQGRSKINKENVGKPWISKSVLEREQRKKEREALRIKKQQAIAQQPKRVVLPEERMSQIERDSQEFQCDGEIADMLRQLIQELELNNLSVLYDNFLREDEDLFEDEDDPQTDQEYVDLLTNLPDQVLLRKRAVISGLHTDQENFAIQRLQNNPDHSAKFRVQMAQERLNRRNEQQQQQVRANQYKRMIKILRLHNLQDLFRTLDAEVGRCPIPGEEIEVTSEAELRTAALKLRSTTVLNEDVRQRIIHLHNRQNREDEEANQQIREQAKIEQSRNLIDQLDEVYIRKLFREIVDKNIGQLTSEQIEGLSPEELREHARNLPNQWLANPDNQQRINNLLYWQTTFAELAPDDVAMDQPTMDQQAIESPREPSGCEFQMSPDQMDSLLSSLPDELVMPDAGRQQPAAEPTTFQSFLDPSEEWIDLNRAFLASQTQHYPPATATGQQSLKQIDQSTGGLSMTPVSYKRKLEEEHDMERVRQLQKMVKSFNDFQLQILFLTLSNVRFRSPIDPEDIGNTSEDNLRQFALGLPAGTLLNEDVQNKIEELNNLPKQMSPEKEHSETVKKLKDLTEYLRNRNIQNQNLERLFPNRRIRDETSIASASGINIEEVRNNVDNELRRLALRMDRETMMQRLPNVYQRIGNVYDQQDLQSLDRFARGTSTCPTLHLSPSSSRAQRVTQDFSHLLSQLDPEPSQTPAGGANQTSELLDLDLFWDQSADQDDQDTEN